MKKISESELEIMKVLWNLKEATSVEIVEEVSKTNDWNKNTIMTLVKRLVQKEFVEVIKKEKAMLIYKPLAKEDEFKLEKAIDFLDKMYEGSLANMIASFTKSNKLSEKDLEDLRKLIDE